MTFPTYAIAYVQSKPLSVFGEQRLAMEGVVGKPRIDLFDRGGRRIVMKIKTKDFVGLDMGVRLRAVALPEGLVTA